MHTSGDRETFEEILQEAQAKLNSALEAKAKREAQPLGDEVKINLKLGALIFIKTNTGPVRQGVA